MSEVSNRRFVHFDGTREEFEAGGYGEYYPESIVFINANGDEYSSIIYTHGEYYGNGGVISKGDVDNSGILIGEYDGYKNRALSKVSLAIGAASTAGLKGWYYKHVNISKKQIFLGSSRTKILGADALTCTSTLYSDSKYTDTSFVSGYEVGDIISLVYNAKYEDYATITAISGNVLTLDKIPFVSGDFFAGVCKSVMATDPDEFSVYCIKYSYNESTKQLTVSKHDVGGVDFGGGALAEGVNNYALNIGAHAEGIQTIAKGQYSHTEGFGTVANYSAHAEGKNTKALGEQSHAEGYGVIASGSNSHAEGGETIASGMRSHSEGANTIASGNTSHAEGVRSTASGPTSHSEGYKTEASADCSHVEGSYTYAKGVSSHAEGKGRTLDDGSIDKSIGAHGTSSHAEGLCVLASGSASHAEGSDTTASGEASHAEGKDTTASHLASHAEGNDTAAYAEASHAEGKGTTASSLASHAEGSDTTASGEASHAEGKGTTASSLASHAEGLSTKSTNVQAHAEGYYSIAKGDTSHAEGCRGLAIGGFSHAEGYGSTIPSNIESASKDEIEKYWDASINFNCAIGSTSHVEGANNLAMGDYSHAEGGMTKAKGKYSHAQGKGTLTTNEAEFACGKYNVSNSGTLFSVGNGTASDRHNILEIKNNDIIIISKTSDNTRGYVKISEIIDSCKLTIYDEDGNVLEKKNKLLIDDSLECLKTYNAMLYEPPTSEEYGVNHTYLQCICPSVASGNITVCVLANEGNTSNNFYSLYNNLLMLNVENSYSSIDYVKFYDINISWASITNAIDGICDLWGYHIQRRSYYKFYFDFVFNLYDPDRGTFYDKRITYKSLDNPNFLTYTYRGYNTYTFKINDDIEISIDCWEDCFLDRHIELRDDTCYYFIQILAFRCNNDTTLNNIFNTFNVSYHE